MQVSVDSSTTLYLWNLLMHNSALMHQKASYDIRAALLKTCLQQGGKDKPGSEQCGLSGNFHFSPPIALLTIMLGVPWL